MKPIYFLAGLAPVAAFVSCASPKAVVVNEQTLEPILAAKIVYAPRVPNGPIVQPGGSSPLALARKADATAQPTAAAPAPAPAPVLASKKETPPAPVSSPVTSPAPAPTKPVAVNAPKPPKPPKPKPVAKNEEPLPTFDPPPAAPQAGGNDGLRMPNMLELPKDEELRSKNAKGKSAPDGGPVIIRPPANADKPKSE